MVDIGSGAKRQVKDFRLSRYACYLIVQNPSARSQRDSVCRECLYEFLIHGYQFCVELDR